MTWTVEDCAIMLQAIVGHDPADPASAARPIPDYRASMDTATLHAPSEIAHYDRPLGLP
jgi:Asp-tRNA(Asn)/Glu-tRNA(Gln) amidotransferase A subunit family amidase